MYYTSLSGDFIQSFGRFYTKFLRSFVLAVGLTGNCLLVRSGSCDLTIGVVIAILAHKTVRIFNTLSEVRVVLRESDEEEVVLSPSLHLSE